MSNRHKHTCRQRDRQTEKCTETERHVYMVRKIDTGTEKERHIRGQRGAQWMWRDKETCTKRERDTDKQKEMHTERDMQMGAERKRGKKTSGSYL